MRNIKPRSGYPLLEHIANVSIYLMTEMTFRIDRLAHHHGMPVGGISRLLPLAIVIPAIIKAILVGQQPSELTARVLAPASDATLI